jgi:hypothetical protein
MASQVPGRALRNNVYGFKVERAAAVLPATTTQTIFTISGGRVLLTLLAAEVTTVTSATATTLAVNLVGSVNGLTQVLANATSVASLSLGTEYAFAALASAPTIGAAFNQNNETVLTPGVIQAVTSATNTGAMKWTIMFIPLDDGATVTAA